MIKKKFKMKLIILLDAKKQKLCDIHHFNVDDVEIVKIDDKKLAQFGFILNLMKSKKYENVYFGCIKLDYQRFHFFMKLYFLLSGFYKGAIIDEDGKEKKFGFLRFFLIEIPLIILEAVASFFVVIYSYVKFPLLKWYLIKKK